MPIISSNNFPQSPQTIVRESTNIINNISSQKLPNISEGKGLKQILENLKEFSTGIVNTPQYNFYQKYSSNSPFNTPGVITSDSLLKYNNINKNNEGFSLQDPQDHIVGQQGGTTEYNSVDGFIQPYNSDNSFLSTSGGLLSIQNNSPFLNSFNETDLDLENPLPNGGPINVSTPQGGTTVFNTVDGFSQPYLPQSPYISSTLLNIQNNSSLSQTFNETDLDLENPLPNGGPISVGLQGGTTIFNTTNGFSQPYLPQSPYISTTLLNIQNNSPSLNIFDKTNLDLENPLPNGGPISVGVQGGTTVFNTVDGFIQTYLPQTPYILSTLTEIQNNSNLSQTFNETDLDLEDPSPNGGPIKVLAQGGTNILNIKAGFNQPYLPSKPLYDGNDVKLTDIQDNSFLEQNFADSGFDLIENEPIIVGPQGGTTVKNFKKGYTQIFTPTNTYLSDINKVGGVYNSIFGNISFIYG